eukprot:gene15023-17769_t
MRVPPNVTLLRVIVHSSVAVNGAESVAVKHPLMGDGGLYCVNTVYTWSAVGQRENVKGEGALQQAVNSRNLKRARTTTTTTTNGHNGNGRKHISDSEEESSEEEESDDDDELENSQPSATPPQRTNGVHKQKAKLKQAPVYKDKDSDNEMETEEQADPASAQESELGIVEFIELENFMCHRHFEIKFGPHVNFISGENGSGKSALLVALIVCLGAKAGFTNRGHKLTDLVKNDASHATITVRLRNRGPEAYKPDEYGSSIVVVRRINKNGSNGYQLKESTGKRTISTRYTDLALILEQFNIQIDNPMSILMQDTKMEKKVEEYRQEYKELQNIVKLEESAEKLKTHLAWSYVCARMRDIEKNKKELDDFQRAYEKHKQRVDETTKLIMNSAENIAKARTDQVSTDQEVARVEAGLRDNEAGMGEIIREEGRTATKFDDINKRVALLKTRRTRIQANLREVQQRKAQSHHNQSKFDAIEKKRLQITDAEARVVTVSADRDALRGEVGEVRRVAEESRRAAADAGHYLSKLERQLQDQRAAKNDVSRPIGMHMRIRDQKMAFAAELMIGKGMLRNFVVNTFQDGQLLEKYAKETGFGQVSYTIYKFAVKPFNMVQHDRLDPSIMTVLRALDFDNEIVRCHVIDSRHIESVALVPLASDAEHLLFGVRPDGIKEVYSMDGTRTFSGRTGRNTTWNHGGQAQYLRANAEDFIESLTIQIQEQKPKVDQLRKAEATASMNQRDIQKRMDGADGELTNINRQIMSLKREIKSIEETIVEDKDDSEAAGLEDGIRDLDKEIETYAEQINEVNEERRSYEDRKKPFTQKRRELERELKSFTDKQDKITAHITRLQKAERDARNQDASLVAENQKHDDRLADINKRLADHEAELAVEREKAEAVCRYVEVSKTPEQVIRDIDHLNDRITRELRGKRRPAEVMEQANEAGGKLEQILQQRKQLDEFKELLKTNLDLRYINWQKIQRKTSKRTAFFFNIFLSKRGFSGNIFFDHEGKRLDVSVHLDKMRPAPAQNTAGDTKTLSGGERSYSTVALLLALWEAMECPFRAMDEFDVFMDEVNRRLSINLLLSKARENMNRQFLFVTPLSLNSITPSPFIFIHKVRAPERGQRTTGALEAYMGYENIILDRIGDKEKASLADTKDLEFIWRGSKSVGEASDIFAHILDDYYWTPNELAFYTDSFEPIGWGMAIDHILKTRGGKYHSPNFMLTVGGDFNYEDDAGFKRLDQTMEYIKNNPRFPFDVKYSTLAEYFDETREWLARNQIPLKYYDHDFLPYSEVGYRSMTQWTGYYTSRPLLKGQSRQTESSLRMAEILDALQPYEDLCQPHRFEDSSLRSAIRVGAYIIIGTSRQLVVNDYISRLKDANQQSNAVIASSIMNLEPSLETVTFNVEGIPIVFTKDDKKRSIGFVNSLGWLRDEMVSIDVVYKDLKPGVPSQCPFTIYDVNNIAVQSDCSYRDKMYHMVFRANVPPMGLSVYTVQEESSKYSYFFASQSSIVQP